MSPSPVPSLLDRVDQTIRTHQLLRPGQRVIVGISGGVDSIVLATALHRLGYEVVGAHVNYGMRGNASDADEAFVQRWGSRLDPPISVQIARRDPEAHAQTRGTSVQAAARDQRYAFMAQCAVEDGIDRVAVGHHRGDQAETLLLNLFRGSGVEGLGGMAWQRPMKDTETVSLIRPLLDVSRAAIEAFAGSHDLPWRSDASNETLRYDRNTIRHQILPVIEEHFSGATDRIANASNQVRAYLDATLQPALEDRFARCAEVLPAGGALRLDLLRAEPSIWRQRIVLEAVQRWLPDAPYTTAIAEEIESLIDAQVGRRVEVAAGTIWRERSQLRFVPKEAAAEPVEPRRVPLDTPTRLPPGTLRVRRVKAPPSRLDEGAPQRVYADADAVSGALTVRTWREGDRFQPLGMAHTKRVSDLLTDEHVPPHQRAGVLVLCDEARIVWVVGYRLAHPVRVRPSTETVFCFEFTPAPDSL